MAILFDAGVGRGHRTMAERAQRRTPNFDRVGPCGNWGLLRSESESESESEAAGAPNEYVTDLVSPARRKHILDGEVRANGTYSGGHRYGTGFPGKSEFPASWSDDRIIHEISDVATDPSLEWKPQGKSGTTFVVNGERDGVALRVIIRNDEIITGFPTNTARNPS